MGGKSGPKSSASGKKTATVPTNDFHWESGSAAPPCLLTSSLQDMKGQVVKPTASKPSKKGSKILASLPSLMSNLKGLSIGGNKRSSISYSYDDRDLPFPSANYFMYQHPNYSFSAQDLTILRPGEGQQTSAFKPSTSPERSYSQNMGFQRRKATAPYNKRFSWAAGDTDGDYLRYESEQLRRFAHSPIEEDECEFQDVPAVQPPAPITTKPKHDNYMNRSAITKSSSYHQFSYPNYPNSNQPSFPSAFGVGGAGGSNGTSSSKNNSNSMYSSGIGTNVTSSTPLPLRPPPPPLENNNNVLSWDQEKALLIKLYEDKLSVLEQKCKQLEEGHRVADSLQDDSRRKSAELSAAQNTIRNLSNLLSDKDTELLTLKDQVNILTNDLGQQTHLVSHLHQKIAESHSYSNYHKSQLAHVQGEVARANAEVNRLQSNNSLLTQRIHALEASAHPHPTPGLPYSGPISKSEGAVGRVVEGSSSGAGAGLGAAAAPVGEEQSRVFEQERLRWMREKELVLQYQKQLQASYAHLHNVNRQLQKQLNKLNHF